MEQLLPYALGVVIAIIAITLYMLPTIYAYKTNHPQWILVGMFNATLGWTIWGYGIVIAYIAFTTKKSA